MRFKIIKMQTHEIDIEEEDEQCPPEYPKRYPEFVGCEK